MKRGGVTTLASEAMMFDRSAGREHEMQQLLAVESVGASCARTHSVVQLRLALLNQEFLEPAQRQFQWVGQRRNTWLWQRPSQPFQRLLSTPASLMTTGI
jgi:hypothetical protein